MVKQTRVVIRRVLWLLAGPLMIVPAVVSAQNAEVVRLSTNLTVECIADGVWMHVSYAEVPGYGRVDANGLLVVEDTQVVMIDTPWNDALTQALVSWVESRFGRRMATVIPTHYHDDNLGGLGYLHRRGVVSWANARTQAECRNRGLPVPQRGFEGEVVMDHSPHTLILCFPGEAHTVDNISVYIPSLHVLFVGCAVRSMESIGLGNTAEANVAAWPHTMRALRARFPEARIVVPGHGRPGGMELVEHTIRLATPRP